MFMMILMLQQSDSDKNIIHEYQCLMPLWWLYISSRLKVYLDDIFGYNIHLELQNVDPYILTEC